MVPLTLIPLYWRRSECLEHLEKKAAAEGCRVRRPSADQVLRQQLVQWGIKQRIPFLGPAHRLRYAPPKPNP